MGAGARRARVIVHVVGSSQLRDMSGGTQGNGPDVAVAATVAVVRSGPAEHGRRSLSVVPAVGIRRRSGTRVKQPKYTTPRRYIRGGREILMEGCAFRTHPQSLMLAMDLRSVSIEARTSPDCNRFVTTCSRRREPPSLTTAIVP